MKNSKAEKYSATDYTDSHGGVPHLPYRSDDEGPNPNTRFSNP